MTPALALATALRREGKYDEARAVIATESAAAGDDPDARLACAVSLAKVERGAGRPALALKLLLEVSQLADLCEDDELRAHYHHGLAVTYQLAGETDAAGVEYAAAAYHWAKAGMPYDAGCTENNLALILAAEGRFIEARDHIGRARSCFSGMAVKLAEVDESEAQILLAQGEPFEALRLVNRAVEVFYAHGETELVRKSLPTLLLAAASCQAGRRKGGVL